MQIKGLHKNTKIFILCEYFRRELNVISRETYFRRKRILQDLHKWIAPPPKRPERVRQPLWQRADIYLVLQIRRENHTYGKAKTTV
ncbi:MAG: hypothetical protein LBD81_03030 [Holosporaceae bacterium]|jgi:hypothetical protein|nr:hypothetical protein [Holosporaceae bacterium]